MSIFNTLQTSRSAIDFFSDRLNLIGVNIASTQTPGYDRQRQVTADNFYQQLSQQGVVSTAAGGGVSETGRQTIFTVGELARTDQSTDLAIDGRGWFPVEDPATGELRLTRVGNFDLDEDGFLRLPDGPALMGLQGPAPRFQVSLDAQNKLVFKVDPAVANAAPGAQGSVLQFDWDGADWSNGGLSFASQVPEGGRGFPLLADGTMLTAATLNQALGELNGGAGVDPGARLNSFSSVETAIARGGLSEAAADDTLRRATQGAGLPIGGTRFDSTASIRAALDAGSISLEEVDTAFAENLPEGLTPALNSLARLQDGLRGGLFTPAELDAALAASPLTVGGQTFDGTAGKAWNDLESVLPLNPQTGVPYTLAEIAEASPRALGVAVAPNGTVAWEFSNGTTAPAAWLRLAEVRDPGALAPVGESLFMPTAAAHLIGDWQMNAPDQFGRGAIIAGTLEMSNVDLTAEFGDLIASQRSFQANSKMLSVMDDLLETLTQLRR